MKNEKCDHFHFLHYSNRWKGENVSTTEVESVVSKAGGLVDCVVYGVEVTIFSHNAVELSYFMIGRSFQIPPFRSGTVTAELAWLQLLERLTSATWPRSD